MKQVTDVNRKRGNSAMRLYGEYEAGRVSRNG